MSGGVTKARETRVELFLASGARPAVPFIARDYVLINATEAPAPDDNYTRAARGSTVCRRVEQ
jgi:hypothetical protein